MTDVNDRFIPMNEAIGKRVPFRGNKAIRYGSSVIIAILFIFIAGSMGSSTALLAKMFWHYESGDKDVYKSMLTGDGYKNWKRTLEATLGMCGAAIILIVILLVLYFLYLYTDFEFAERLSLNLATATQGPNRLRKVAGLLTNYVYPPGTISPEVRNSLANQFIIRLRQAYVTQNRISPLTANEYENLQATRSQAFGTDKKGNTIATGWGTGFRPGADEPTSAEYQKLRQKAVQIAGPGSDLNQQSDMFNRLANEYKERIKALNEKQYVKSMGEMTPEQRAAEMQYLPSVREGINTAQQAHEAAKDELRSAQTDRSALDAQIAGQEARLKGVETGSPEHIQAATELSNAENKRNAIDDHLSELQNKVNMAKQNLTNLQNTKTPMK